MVKLSALRSFWQFLTNILFDAAVEAYIIKDIVDLLYLII